MKFLHARVEEILGAPVYLVGGCVRDFLMGREPHDFDFCTALEPEEITARVKAAGRHAYTTGARFGTVGLKVADEHGVFQMVEVTTFRTERYEEGSRKPAVEFVGNLTHDLSRRDFTMNAIAMRGGKVIDPHDGREDISHGLVRAVGNARERVREDPLRMLRAARFASQFGFSVDSEMVEAMTRYAHRIQQVSRERWMAEMDKLLLCPKASRGLQVLADTKILNFMLPEVALQVGYDQNNPHHNLTLFEHTLAVVGKVPVDIDMRWAALLHDVGKPFMRQEKTPEHSTYIRHDMVSAELVRGIALRLKWSRERRESVEEIVAHHMDEDSVLRLYDHISKGIES